MRLSALTIAAISAVLVLSPAPAVSADRASSDPAGSKDDPPATVHPDGSGVMMRALRRDLGLSATESRVRLAHEAAAPFIERRLRAQLGERFGGAWFDGGTSRLRVGITRAADAPAVRVVGADPVVVRRSQRQLDAIKARLDRSAGRMSNAVYGWYVDVASNSVALSAATPAAGREAIAQSRLGQTAVRIVTSSHAPRLVYDVRGGDQYAINNQALCSVGFSVSGGFVTAGHCGGAGSSTAGYNGIAQGTVQGSSFPGNDYGWVRVNPSWTPRPWVNNYAGGNVAVTGSRDATVGSSVCRSGRTTGWRCGTIQAKSVTVNYSGALVYGLTQTSACAEPGDSGGPYLTGNEAQGVTSGAAGNCGNGGYTFFQPVNEILQTYGLALTTTGGSTSRIIGYAGKCIDVPYANGVDGQYLWIWQCNSTAAQAWTFMGDGTIRAFGLCMDVAWGSTQNGAIIQLAHCSGNPAQQFVLTAAGDLVNPQANKCVDVKDWNTADGARLQIWDCHGGANQKWYRG